MNRTILTLITVVLFIPSLFSQEAAITLNARYLPEKEYLTTSTATVKGTISFKADKKTKEILEESGVTLPMQLENNSHTEALITTGTSVDGKFPIRFRYTKSLSASTVAGQTEEEEGPLLNAIISGTYDSNNHIEITSISGAYLHEGIKKVITSTLESLQEKIKFPDHPLKIGDKFTQEIPFNFPVEGLDNSDMSIICTYKLTAIKGNIAFFDLKEKISFNMSAADNTIELRGGGKGKGMFDISNNFFIYSSSLLTFKMDLSAQGLKAKAKMYSSTTEEITINSYYDFEEEIIEEAQYAEDVAYATTDAIQVIEEDPDVMDALAYEDYVMEESVSEEYVEISDQNVIMDELPEDVVVEEARTDNDVFIVTEEDMGNYDDESVVEIIEEAPTEDDVIIEITEETSMEEAPSIQDDKLHLQGREWRLTELNGKAVKNPSSDNSVFFILFSKGDNNFFGSGDCNRFFGKYEEKNEGWITLSEIGMTKRGCPDMSTEEELIQTLKSVNSYTIDGDTLILKKGGKYQVAKFVYETTEIEITTIDE